MFTNEFSNNLHAEKYRLPGESFDDAMSRVARALSDSSVHEGELKDILHSMRFLPAGRVQASVGTGREITPYNCFVSDTIPDSMNGIMKAATDAATTLRMGGGIGYDFSTLRPRGSTIESLGSHSSGPVSFMSIFDAVCKTIASAGHRRGAQMGVMRIDHPDIHEFISAKRDTSSLTAFNISVGVTDDFMRKVIRGEKLPLVFEGLKCGETDARLLWEQLMHTAWDWAEPGVLFLDTINRRNNLWYCENIVATNPCGEQPLPPNGACLLGSFNLTQYLVESDNGLLFHHEKLKRDVHTVVRAMDNVVDVASYPLSAQEDEAKSKRRMGLGVTGLANTLEMMGLPYASEKFMQVAKTILENLRDSSYIASALLAAEKGSFPLYSHTHFQMGHTFKTLSRRAQDYITYSGLRNSHLTSIAPTGTISLAANNVSSGIEPVFAHTVKRVVQTPQGPTEVVLEDYARKVAGVEGKTADQCSVDDHLSVLLLASQLVDSAVSKTCNVGPDVPYSEFVNLYSRAWSGGAKGCTTFRTAGKRMGILTDANAGEGGACTIDPTTGERSCE